jgi:hypothetical protein
MDKDFIKYLKTGKKIEHPQAEGGYLVPPRFNNLLDWIILVQPKIDKLVIDLLKEGKRAEALAMLQLEHGEV